MDTIARLMEDHKKLRASLASLMKLIPLALKCECDEKDCIKRLRQTEQVFLKDIKEHEETEERLLSEAARRNRESEKLFISAAADHQAINAVIEVLSSLISVFPYCDPYSAQFAISMMAHDLISHMDYEEVVLFPLLRNQADSEIHVKPEIGQPAALHH